MNITITHRGETVTVPESEWQATVDALVARLGPWVSGESSADIVCAAEEAAKALSTWTTQIVDKTAQERILAQQATLQVGGLQVGRSQQLFDSGTRMAAIGYETQDARYIEHAELADIADVAADLTHRVKVEKRKDIMMSVGDLGQHLAMNGHLTVDGLRLSEQAIRGLLARIKSPALSYVLGLRDRIRDRKAFPGETAADREALLDVLQRECSRFGGTELQVRTREGIGDIFAIVSPGYGVADAPQVLPDVLDALPSGCKGTLAYDPISTTWEIRASNWTPTPVDEQAVGEAFSGYVSFSGRDNGTRALTGGGGIYLIACLNASTYQVESGTSRRIHKGQVLIDLPSMVREATRAIHLLCQAWGVARTDVVEPVFYQNKLVPMEALVPGLFRAMLTSRKGELIGVLPGRTETHVEKLAMVYPAQRRDQGQIVRSDLAQAWTRYAQDQPAPVRRTAETAIGAWMIARPPMEWARA